MPLELLKQLAKSDLPVTLQDPQEIDKLRVLRAAGMVHADIGDVSDHSAAVVHSITELGHQAIFLDRDPSQ